MSDIQVGLAKYYIIYKFKFLLYTKIKLNIMGVPNFYSWLVKRYPMCLYDFNDVLFLNSLHYSNFLYMDMNQIIYKCATNPNVLFKDQVRQRMFDEIWITIFNYLNQIITLVNPQMVLFLTFDGVAPRAKMNQQRQRRFQSAKRYGHLNAQLHNLNVLSQNETFKNNQISPGTNFMHELNNQVRFFIKRKLNEDKRWRHLKIVFSGSDVPGEGEHKILEFIRNIQKEPNFDKHWTHMIYGAGFFIKVIQAIYLDADLIMLGLSTQLRYITIVRENLGKFNHNNYLQIVSTAAQRYIEVPKFQLINLTIVREYMDLEYRVLNMKIPYDIYRVIDDFILVCFFIGNDFLPRIFCFDIRFFIPKLINFQKKRQGTLETLIELFKQHLCTCNNYLTDRGDINWVEFTRLVKRLTEFEILALQSRQEEMKAFLSENKTYNDDQLIILKELTMVEKLTQFYSEGKSIDARTSFYEEKCDIQIEKVEGLNVIQDMTEKYCSGIQFVLYYYLKGVPSWSWYYPFYYAPLCGDIYLFLSYLMEEHGQEKFTSTEMFEFDKGQPFPPFKQLLSILSPENANLLPSAYGNLLTSMNSPLRSPVDYYPSDFVIDPYGAIWEHQFIAKVPFLDENLVSEQYEKNQLTLTAFELDKNRFAKSTCYESSDKAQLVKSTLPKLIPDFNSFHRQWDFEIENIEMCGSVIRGSWKMIQQDIFKVIRNLLYLLLKQIILDKPTIPSLKICGFENVQLKDLKDTERRSHQMTIELKQNDNISLIAQIKESAVQSKCKKKYLELLPLAIYAYCGYPIPIYSEIVCVMSQQSLIPAYHYLSRDIDFLDKSDYRKEEHLYHFNNLRKSKLLTKTFVYFQLFMKK